MASLTEITESEVQKHADAKDLWLIIDGNVYDVTKFIDEHPGGADTLLEHAGTDASQAFKDVGHSADARELMTKYQVGKLQGGGNKFCSAGACTTRSTPSVSFRVHREEEPLSRNKSCISAKSIQSSTRIAVPKVSNPLDKFMTETDPVRKMSNTFPPSCAKCRSCRGQDTKSRSKTSLDCRTKSVTSTRAPSITTKSASSMGVPLVHQKSVACGPSLHSDLPNVKPVTSTGSSVNFARTKSAVSPKISFRTTPSLRTASSDTSSRIPRPLPDVVKSATATGTKSGSGSVSEASVKPDTVSRPIPNKTMPDPDPYVPPETSSIPNDVWRISLVAVAGAIVVAVVLKKTGKI